MTKRKNRRRTTSKKYKTVVIDFPWPIRISNSPKSLKGSSLKASLPYNEMSLDEIQTFDIERFAEKECQIFLWVTTGKIKEIPIMKIGLELLEKWGFKYHQIITWGKTSGVCVYSPIRSMTEHCIYGYRGKLPAGFSHMPNLFTTSQHKHSQKPARFYQMIRSWTPSPRIDLFARLHHIGFDGWGEEYVGEGELSKYL